MKIGLLENQSFREFSPGLSSGEHYIRFPLALGFTGSKRLKEIQQILQDDSASIVERFAAYELADELVSALSLKGIRLGPNGECEYLSPKRWLPSPAILFDAGSIQEYFTKEQIKYVELLVPRWALAFRKKVDEAAILSLYEQMLSPVSPYLNFRVEK